MYFEELNFEEAQYFNTSKYVKIWKYLETLEIIQQDQVFDVMSVNGESG